MKTLLKVLTPTISTIGIATISLASCSTTSSDGYVAVPTELLDIDGTTLKGFKEPTEAIKNYSKITVSKDIETVQLIYHTSYIAFDAIKKIDYESDSKWKTIEDIANFNNLEILVLPPKLSSIKIHSVSSCKKLNTIDISNVEDITCLTNTNWIELNGTAKYGSGTLIIKHSQADNVQAIKTNNPCLENFEVKEK